ncbi:MAG TPA: GNAT family N-acetyltransferase [Anaerolineales bacterium]|nr:GNAT family N-acetyltransferase [Anaerolineales bacterium]
MALELTLGIQPASWRDFSDFVALERVCFEKDSWPWMDVLAALTFPETVHLKAVHDGRTVGFVIGDRRRRQGVGWIASIGVHPEYRRRGIGMRLLTACEAALSVPRIRLTLRASNRGARALYDQAGYAAVDFWRRYYHDGEDGVVMEKKIPLEAAPG